MYTPIVLGEVDPQAPFHDVILDDAKQLIYRDMFLMNVGSGVLAGLVLYYLLGTLKR